MAEALHPSLSSDSAEVARSSMYAEQRHASAAAMFMSPSSNISSAAPHIVQRNVATNVAEFRTNSFFLLMLSLVILITEAIVSLIVLIETRNDTCDVPLYTWLSLFSGRLIFLLPISASYTVAYLRNIPPYALSESLNNAVSSYGFIIFLIGNIWLFASDTCSTTAPKLYYYSLVLLLITFAYILAPLLLLICICFCLPFVLFAIRCFGLGDRGASSSMIEKLPVKNYTTTEGEEAPMCAICMCEFCDGEKLRILPCYHEFHQACVDQWLKIKKECPLCRFEIDKDQQMDSVSSEVPLDVVV